VLIVVEGSVVLTRGRRLVRMEVREVRDDTKETTKSD